MEAKPHISVCVCTYKRPALLADLLDGVFRQITEGLFSYSVVVVDNDGEASARATADRYEKSHPGQLKYVVEQQQNISLARNRSVAEAKGDFVAFIDDDEVPNADWLLRLYQALLTYKVDGVLGPVLGRFVNSPPQWAIKAGFFDRPGAPTGTAIDWRETGTGNVLVRRSVVAELEGPFRLQFGSGGEDKDFFHRSVQLGRKHIWCAEAVAYELVPQERTTVSFQLRRALLRGKAALASPTSGSLKGIAKSAVACAGYTVFLPVSVILGRHIFFKYLVKNCDHLGKLLALCRINPIREKYVLR